MKNLFFVIAMVLNTLGTTWFAFNYCEQWYKTRMELPHEIVIYDWQNKLAITYNGWPKIKDDVVYVYEATQKVVEDISHLVE